MRATMRLAVVGISHRRICGVRDHAEILARELEDAHGVECSLHWLTRGEFSLGASRAEVRQWTRALTSELRAESPDAILLHYSVFAYSYKGLPLFLRNTLAAVRRAQAPIVAFLHEFAYPWHLGGVRGTAWSISQRVALAGIMRACSGALVTQDRRAEWLGSSLWLSDRPVLVAPVFSNLPRPEPRAGNEADSLVGVFGYSAQGAAVSLILDAIALLRARGLAVDLRLLGAPGPESAAGEQWAAGAAARGLDDVVSFSGTLPAQELSNGLAGCDLLLFSEPSGPTSRKTTLAGALASGTALLAIDGELTWERLRRAQAVRLAAPAAAAIADAAQELLSDRRALADLGAQGQAFARAEMSIASTGAAVVEMLQTLVPEQQAGRR